MAQQEFLRFIFGLKARFWRRKIDKKRAKDKTSPSGHLSPTFFLFFKYYFVLKTKAYSDSLISLKPIKRSHKIPILSREHTRCCIVIHYLKKMSRFFSKHLSWLSYIRLTRGFLPGNLAHLAHQLKIAIINLLAYSNFRQIKAYDWRANE
jgi:hypothetical protein